jgi:uncharacterized protein (DUF952 family)
MIFHLAEPAAWADAQRADDRCYRAASLATQGFIHLSFPDQVAATFERYYTGRDDLVLLEVDEHHPVIAAALVVEQGLSGGQFPHLYAPLALDAVIRSTEYRADSDA